MASNKANILFLVLGLISCYNALQYSEIIRRFSRQVSECRIPPDPPNGNYTIGGNHENVFKEGDYVSEYSNLVLTCNTDYKPLSKNTICEQGSWHPKPNYCARKCLTLTSNESTKVVCSFNNVPTTCHEPIEGTKATFTCAPYYDDSSIEDYPTRKCVNGQWTGIPYCLPICGDKRSLGVLNVVNGKNSVKGSYPWHVAIYNSTGSKDYMCGGSLIGRRVVVTAAHCVSHRVSGEPFPENQFLIGAGKYYRKYEDPRDEDPQYAPIEKINIPSNYKGSGLQYEVDIAVIILTHSLKLTADVQPICVDWLDRFELQELNYGVVTGWGYTKEGQDLADNLREIKIPYVSDVTCYATYPKQSIKFIRQDKICAGFVNRGIGICEGDSGGSLAFPFNKSRSGIEKYYIKGIVSISAQNNVGQCDSNHYGLFTRISKHLDFLKQFMHVPDKVSAPPPAFPTVLSVPVPIPTIFTSIYPSTSETSASFNSNKCQIPENPPHGKYIISDYGEERQESDVSPNTTLTIKCDENYYIDSVELQSSTCKNGTWVPKQRKCYPCGKRNIQENAVDGKYLKQFPWHVGIYRIQEFICNGVIINQRVILSVASCFTDDNGASKFAKEIYHVAAGKYYNKFDDPRDQFAQHSLIDAIHFSNRYMGELAYYAHDIAVLILQQPLTLSIVIQPVCIDFENSFKREQFTNGVVTGWGFINEYRQSTEELNEIELSLLSKRECDGRLPTRFKKYQIYDKFCTHNLNNDNRTCEVGLGAPLVSLQSENKYYLRGIASVSPTKEHTKCNSNPLIFVIVSKYLNFVQDIINLNKI